MNQNVYTVYISNRQAQINTMDIILTIPIYNALPYTYIHICKTPKECKLIKFLQEIFFGRGWLGGDDALDIDMYICNTYIPPPRQSCPPFHSLGPGYRPAHCGCSIHFLSNGNNHSSLRKQKIKLCYYLP